MKKQLVKTGYILSAIGIFTIFALLASSVLTLRAQAAANTMYLSPAAQSVQQDATFSIALRINPGSAASAIESTVTYDTSKLQFLSFNEAGTALSTALLQQASGSTLRSDRATLGTDISADSLIVIYNFKALASSGSASLQLAGNAVGPSGYINPAVVGATINFTAPPAPAPAPDPAPAPAPSTPSTDTTTTTPEKKTTTNTSPEKAAETTAEKAKIDTKTEVVAMTRATINVNSTVPVKTYINYGLSEKLGKVTTQTDLATKHSVGLDSNLLVPGTTYYYQAVSETASGERITSAIKSFKTKGYTLRIVARTADGKLLKNTKLTLHSDPITAETNNEGVVEFTDIAPGEHELAYEQGSERFTQKLSVVDDKAALASKDQVAAAQSMSVTFGGVKSSSGGISKVLLFIILSLVSVLFVIVTILIIKPRLRRRIFGVFGKKHADDGYNYEIQQ